MSWIALIRSGNKFQIAALVFGASSSMRSAMADTPSPGSEIRIRRPVGSADAGFGMDDPLYMDRGDEGATPTVGATIARTVRGKETRYFPRLTICLQSEAYDFAMNASGGVA